MTGTKFTPTETVETIAEGITRIITTRNNSVSFERIEREGSNFSIIVSGGEPVMFEHHELGDEWGGGLTFEGKKLTDYDGVYSLPKGVIKTLKAIGYDCSYAE
jgi:hypothetical protein